MNIANVTLGLILAAVVSPAGAVVAVLGPRPQYTCYLAAKTGRDIPNGLKACTSALEGNLALSDKYATLINRGVIDYALKDSKSALADFVAGVALNPDGGDAYIDRGIMLAIERRFPEALADFNKGIELRSGNAYLGYYNRAIIEENAGNASAAYHDYQQALVIEPQFQLAADQLKRFSVVKPPPGSGTFSPQLRIVMR